MTAGITSFAKADDALRFFDGAIAKLAKRLLVVADQPAAGALVDSFKAELLGKPAAVTKGDLDKAAAAIASAHHGAEAAVATARAELAATTAAPPTLSANIPAGLTPEQAFLKAIEADPALYDGVRASESRREELSERLSKSGPAPALALAVDELRKRDPNLTREQATLKALEANPNLYEG
jgi:hypothetical protein